MTSIFEEGITNKLIDLYSRDVSVAELSRDLKISEGLISDILKHNKIHIRGSKTLPTSHYGSGNINTYINEYLNGATLTSISKKYRIRSKFLSYLLIEEGVRIRCPRKKYQDNDEAFDMVDDEESAYWLGFLYADGSIYTANNRHLVSISVSHKDVRHLIKFRDWISPSRPVNKYLAKCQSGTYPTSRISVTSKIICNDLIRLGCMPAKTHILTFPTKDRVPDKYIHHFMRGYFDGDGCIYNKIKNSNNTHKTFVICGTYHFISGYVEILYTLGINKCKITNRRGTHRWAKSKDKDIYAIYNFLYKGASVYLERKEEIFRGNNIVRRS